MTVDQDAHAVTATSHVAAEIKVRSSRRPTTRILVRFVHNPAAVGALVCLVVLIASAALAPLISGYDPNETDTSNTLRGPSRAHWFGTDDLGRDLFSRTLHGGRISLLSAFVATTVAALIGVPLGLLAGYAKGRLDWVISRVSDAFLAMPPILFVMAVVAAIGVTTTNVMAVIGVVYGPRVFRIARAATQSVASETYIAALVALGVRRRRIIISHLLPAIASPLTVQLSLLMGFSLLAEASLSFLGIGVQPPGASWGVLLRRGFKSIYNSWTGVVFPGFAITLAILSFALIGDGLRDAVTRAGGGE